VKLSLGPVLYYWTREALLGFYANLPHSRLATIYLGEVVCGRRHAMRPADWLGLARDLAQTPLRYTAHLKAISRVREDELQSEFSASVRDAS